MIILLCRDDLLCYHCNTRVFDVFIVSRDGEPAGVRLFVAMKVRELINLIFSNEFLQIQLIHAVFWLVDFQVKIGNSKPAFLAIASPPKATASGSMEFLIKAVDGTTAGMLCNLGKGDKVELSQVMGSGFRIDQIAPAEDFPTILLFATGSGIR